jgi:pyrroline-5-carboxylate reductase
MGSALHHAWLKNGMSKKSIVINDVHKPAKTLKEIDFIPECIVLAIKPQAMNEVLPALAKKFGKKPLYISIAAGKTTASLQKYLKGAAIVRAMPNTPALIGKGITVLYANAHTTGKQKKIATKLLQAAGETVWVKNEQLMNAVTAISGSGPAYVFLFLEALIKAGTAHGLPQDIAKQLALHTLTGSGKLARLSKEPLSKLRANVTSKGGTTEAALSVLTKNRQFESLLAEAVSEAVKRAKELA